MKTFPHEYKTIIGAIDIAGINGYLKGLLQVVDYINETTKGNPDNRFIDAVPLLDKIKATCDELNELAKEADTDLNKFLNLIP
jgi:hypothetical protein